MEINMTGFFSKKGIKSILSMALSAAVVFGLASCNNGDDPAVINDGETKTVVLKLEGAAPTSYAETPPAGANVVSLSSAYLFFVDTDGEIVDRYHFTSAATDLPNKIINLNPTAPIVIDSIPASIVAGHFVGNPATTLATIGAIGQNISAVKAATIDITAQKDITRLNLYGTAGLVEAGDVYSCTIYPKPTVARIELSKIANTAEQSNDPSEEDPTPKFDPYKFNLKGIFIDNYFREGTVAGDVAAFQSNGNGSAPYSSGSTEYPGNYLGATFDWYSTAKSQTVDATGNYVTPNTAGHVWAYNLPMAVDGSVAPRVLFNIGVETDPDDAEGTYETRFVTVNGFQQPGGGIISTFEPGKVYTVGTVVFKAGVETTLDEDGKEVEEPVTPPATPTPEVIDVTVSISSFTWVVVPVTPIVTQ